METTEIKEPLPVLIKHPAASMVWRAFIKRAIDIIASSLGLLLLTPFLLPVAVLIRRESYGPIFYRGVRLGRGGKPFTILKFRTMYERPETYHGARITAKGDERITPLGHWLRGTKLNELPQLWNVLVGDMSLVGPRPEDPEVAASWPAESRDEILSMRPRLAAFSRHVPVVIGTLPGLGVLYSQDDFRTRILRRIYRPLQRFACNHSDLTIFQNQNDFDQLIREKVISPMKAVILPGSGIDTQIFDPERFSPEARKEIRRSLNLDGNQIVVIMISRLIRSKGVLEFANVAAALMSQHPQARFLLIGSIDKNSLDVLTPEEFRYLEDSVSCLGERSDIPELLAISDIFVLPTVYREGIPRVILEAASMGIPVVTTDTPGCREVIQNNMSGYLVPKNDLDTLTTTVRKLILEPSLRKELGKQSRWMAVNRFELKLIVERLIAMYGQLLGTKTHGR